MLTYLLVDITQGIVPGMLQHMQYSHHSAISHHQLLYMWYNGETKHCQFCITMLVVSASSVQEVVRGNWKPFKAQGMTPNLLPGGMDGSSQPFIVGLLLPKWTLQDRKHSLCHDPSKHLCQVAVF